MKPARLDSPPSMTRRLILLLTLVTTLIWLLAAVLGILVMEEEMAEIFDGTLQDTAERLVPLALDDLDNRGTNVLPKQLQANDASGEREYLIYQVRDADGRILIRSHDAPEQPFEAPLTPGFSQSANYQFYTAPSEDRRVFVQVADAFKNRIEALQEGAMALFLPLIFLIPVSGMAIWFVVQRTVRPMDELRHDIEKKDSGNMEPIDAAKLPKELQPIAASVNRLMARLSAALDAEREFTSNSAHELRTPIAGALAQTQMLISELQLADNRNRAKQIEASLVRLSHLAEKLLQLSRAEAGIGLTNKAVDLGQVIDLVVTDFRRSMPDPERLVLERVNNASLIRPISEDAFAIVLRNLIENAIVHGDRSSAVMVILEDDGPIRIVNGGPLLSTADLAEVRRRFKRGPTDAAGSGLGLSIVARLLDQMNGRLILLSPAPGHEGGLEATIELLARTPPI